MERTMLRIDTGDKPLAEAVSTTGRHRVPADDTADVRDILSGLVGRKISSMADDDTRHDYARLKELLGLQKANKLMSQVFLHNARNASTPMEKSIQDFYDIGSNDKDVSDVLRNVKTIGYGVLPGFRESSKQTNQLLTGRIPISTASANNSNFQEKVMLRLTN